MAVVEDVTPQVKDREYKVNLTSQDLSCLKTGLNKILNLAKHESNRDVDIETCVAILASFIPGDPLDDVDEDLLSDFLLLKTTFFG